MKVVATNRKAKGNYDILEKIEAGIALLGSEVKSLREGRVSLQDSYATIEDGEVYLQNCHIQPYGSSSHFNHDPLRPKKLLLHKKEIKRLIGKVTLKGLTLIPLRIYFNRRGLAKVELAVAKGRKTIDKRAKLKEKELKREARRALKYGY